MAKTKENVMLFDENYDRLIEILGNCDEDFLADYQNFDEEFKFITETINSPFESRNDIDL